MGRIDGIATVQPRLADRLFRSTPVRWRRLLVAAFAVTVLHVYFLALVLSIEVDEPAPAIEAALPADIDDISNFNPAMLGEAADGPPVTIPPPPGFANTGSGGGIDMPGSVGLIRVGSGNTHSPSAAASGLDWLARHQAPSGRWGIHDFSSYVGCNCSDCGLERDPAAATGLALLPFLAAGQTHKGTGRNQLYQPVVERGLRQLLQQQNEEGGFGGPFANALATWALCEAYGMTADPNLKQPAQRAAAWIASTQRKDGGWSEPADLETTAWQVLALKSAQMAGLNLSNATWSGVTGYLDAAGNADGCFYRTRDLTPAALHCRMLLGWNHRHPGLDRGIVWMTEDGPGARRESIVTLYHAHQVAHYFGRVDCWDGQVRDLLAGKQDKGSIRCQKGSWSPGDDSAGKKLGRLGTTALAVLVLETHYPRFYWGRRNLGAMKDEAIRDALK